MLFRSKAIQYGADWDETSTIGGFPFWIQDWEYTPCPDCGKPMKFVAKLSWEMLDFMEGNCYVEVCPECQGKGLHLKKLPLLKVDVGKVCKTCGGSGYLPQ